MSRNQAIELLADRLSGEQKKFKDVDIIPWISGSFSQPEIILPATSPYAIFFAKTEDLRQGLIKQYVANNAKQIL
jgi:hypothetical protein